MAETPGSSADRQQIEDDIRTVVGGNFTPFGLRPEVYDEIVSRVRARAGAYLDVFESLFLGAKFDAVQQSNLYLPAFLLMVRDVDPDRVRSIAGQLAKQYDAILVLHDAVTDKDGLLASLPMDTANMVARIAQRRGQLKNLAN